MDLGLYIARIEFIDYFVLLINLLLLFSARLILKFFQSESTETASFHFKVQNFRALNLLIILTYGYINVYQNAEISGIGLKLISIWVIIYLSYLIKQIMSYWVRNKYGRIRDVNGDKRSIETYTSRLLSMMGG